MLRLILIDFLSQSKLKRFQSSNQQILMSKYKYEKQFIFFQRRPDQAIRFLKDIQNLDLTQVLDQKYNNCLHQCAFQGSLKLMKVYVDHQKLYFKRNPLVRADRIGRGQRDDKEVDEQQINQRIKDWVNSVNKQGFTASHYAAFKGFIDVLDFMAGLGANHQIKTKSGLRMLHLAAQGDQIKTFIYYRNKIPIDDLDDRKSTPLHWAAFSGSERVTEYLLAERALQIKQQKSSKKNNKNKNNRLLKQQQQERQLKSNWIDAQDVEMQTALHLATGNGNTKIVRRLLIAGANRHIKNKQNKQPIEIAQENEFLNIEQFLNDKYSWLDYVKFFMNVKIKYEPRKKSMFMPIIFFILALSLVGTINFALDYSNSDYQFVEWIQNGLFALLIVLYLSLIFHSPKLQRGSYNKLLIRLVPKSQKESKPNSIVQSEHTFINSSRTKSNSFHKSTQALCFRCVQFKPARSYHCDICNTCIPQYDHHCPWINNCVGKHNIGRFICFIVLLFAALCWILVIGIIFILYLIYGEDQSMDIFEFKQWIIDQNSVMYVYVVVALLLFVVFALPLLLLIGVHIRNLCYGKTTYERFSKANQSFLIKSEQAARTHSGISGFEQKSKRNSCLEMCINREEDEDKLLDD